jgi:hypothetical protein
MALSYAQPSVNQDLLRSGGRRAKTQAGYAIVRSQLGTIKLNIISIVFTIEPLRL